MPIVVQQIPAQEIKNLAQEAGEGIKLEREQQLQLNAAANERANQQLQLQAEAQLFEQQLQVQGLLDARQVADNNLRLAELKMMNELDQQTFDNQLAIATEQRFRDRLEFEKQQDAVSNAAAEAKVQRDIEKDKRTQIQQQTENKLKAGKLAVDQGELQVKVDKVQLARDKVAQDKIVQQQKVEQNKSLMQPFLQFADPREIAGLSVAAQYLEPEHFQKELRQVAQELPMGVSKTLAFARSAIAAKLEAVEAEIKQLLATKSAVIASEGGAADSALNPDSSVPAIDIALAEVYERQIALLNSKQMIQPGNAITSLSETEKILGDKTRSTMMQAIATRNTKTKFMDMAKSLAAQSLAGNENVDPNQVAQQASEIFNELMEQKANLFTEMESREFSRILYLHGWVD